MNDNVYNAWRCCGFMLILSVIVVNTVDSVEIDLIEDLNGLSSSKSMIHHSTFWTINLTKNNGNNFLSQNATERILKVLSENKGFSLCVTLTQNISNSGSIFSIVYQGRIRFLDIKVSMKRRVVKVQYFPEWKTYRYRTEKFVFPPTNSPWAVLCIEYINSKWEMSLNANCKTVATVKLREPIASKSFSNKNIYEFKVWVAAKSTNNAFLKGTLKNMIFSDNSRFSAEYCRLFPPQQSTLRVVANTQSNAILDRMNAMEGELALLKQQLAETQKYLKDVKQCQCFPQCVTSTGHSKSFAEAWMESPCSNCTCTLQGKVCHQQPCPALPCSKNITEPGKCCPRCPYNCQYQRKKYPHDQSFSISCMDCHCNDGTLSCRRIDPEVQCPKLQCPKFLQIKPKGQCCKKCKIFNLCKLTTCGSNAVCRESPSVFGCQCVEGFQGNPYTGCVDIDECKDPKKCPSNNFCTNTNGSYACECRPGYKKVNSSSNLCKATCARHPCQNNSTCTAPDQCECKAGFTGPSCSEDIDECILGLVNCPSHSQCVNIPGGYTCNCISGYYPFPSDVLSVSFDHQCLDDNECVGTRGVNHHCDSSSSCENIPGGYRCIPRLDQSQPFGSNCAIQKQNGEITLLYDRNQLNFVDNCKTCRCQSGTLECQAIRCDCTDSSMAHCCPKCLRNLCYTKDDSQRQLVERSSLNCSLTESNCSSVRCPRVTCRDPIALPGQCCKYCRSDSITSCVIAYNTLSSISPTLIEYLAKCSMAGRTYNSGQNIIHQRLPGGDCIKCLCWDGHLCCGKSFACSDLTKAP